MIEEEHTIDKVFQTYYKLISSTLNIYFLLPNELIQFLNICNRGCKSATKPIVI